MENHARKYVMYVACNIYIFTLENREACSNLRERILCGDCVVNADVKHFFKLHKFQLTPSQAPTIFPCEQSLQRSNCELLRD